MESQLPNIVGGFNFRGASWETMGAFLDTNGAFYYSTTGVRPAQWNVASGYAGTANQPTFHLNANRSSGIYKDNVTQVFTDSVAMNAWIKCKKMNIAI